MNLKHTVAVVDDHHLVRNAIAQLINSLDDFEVLFEADHGADYLEQMKERSVQQLPMPAIVLMDIEMPKLNGYETTLASKQSYPATKILALSMLGDDFSVIKMLKNGASGYLLKNTHPRELEFALKQILANGHYYNEMVHGKISKTQHFVDNQGMLERKGSALTAKEEEYLRLLCTERTQKEIADIMCLSLRTVDWYRTHLVEKLDVKTRIGLVVYAIRCGLFDE